MPVTLSRFVASPPAPSSSAGRHALLISHLRDLATGMTWGQKNRFQRAGGTWGKLCRLDDFTKRSRSVTEDKTTTAACLDGLAGDHF